MVSVTERGQAPATQGGLWAAFKTALHRHESIRGYLLLSPTLLVMLALMIIPLLGLVVLSFCTQVYFDIDYTPTLKNYFAIFGTNARKRRGLSTRILRIVSAIAMGSVGVRTR